MRGATVLHFLGVDVCLISIHAPREGSDQCASLWYTESTISIHAPREGATGKLIRMSGGLIFQSTLPVRGATWLAGVFGDPNVISIHAPREGSDGEAEGADDHGRISIHAPREGSDGVQDIAWQFGDDFNPRSREGATAPTAPYCTWSQFQSTLPVRGATFSPSFIWIYVSLFQSTLPVRGATSDSAWSRPIPTFQSTLPVRGATPRNRGTGFWWSDFNPRSP